MEHRQFDALARRFAEMTEPALPRRGLMRLFGAAALAAALGQAPDAEFADARKRRKNRKKKGKGKNKSKNKRCKKDGKKCRRSKDCCAGSTCRDGRCSGSRGRCGTTVDFSTRWGSTGTGNGQFRSPWGIAIDRNDNVYVTDTGNSRIQVFDQNGSFIRKWGAQGNGPDRFQEPRGIGVNQESGNSSSLRAYISDPAQSNAAHRLRKFRTDGTDLASMGQSGLSNPRGVAIDANNNVWVVDGSSGQIFLFDSGGNYRANWAPGGGGALSSPEGIAVFRDTDRATYVYVTDRGNNRVVKFEYTGNGADGLRFVKAAGSQGGGSSSFNEPCGVAADACGNLWVADRINNRIQQLDKNLTFRSRFTASMNRPTGVAVSTDGRFLFVADSANDQIQKFSLS